MCRQPAEMLQNSRESAVTAISSGLDGRGPSNRDDPGPNLLGRQALWLDLLEGFQFDVHGVSGVGSTLSAQGCDRHDRIPTRSRQGPQPSSCLDGVFRKPGDSGSSARRDLSFFGAFP